MPEVLSILRARGNPRNVEGMARFGITSVKAFGVSAPFIRSLAKKIGRDHELALKLWATGILEARAMAALIGDPKRVTKSLMNSWVKDFDNWAVCDCACGILFDKTPFAYEMAMHMDEAKRRIRPACRICDDGIIGCSRQTSIRRTIPEIPSHHSSRIDR